MATLDEIIGDEQLTVDYSEDTASVDRAQNNLRGLEKEPISPVDLSQIFNLPTSPATKRNALQAGLESGGRLSDELNNRLNNIIPEAEARKQEIRQNSDIIQSILAGRQKNVETGGQLKADEILLKQSYAERRAQEAAALLQRSGTDIGDIDSAVNNAAIQLPKLYLQMDALQKEIDRKASSSFFDNPVDWVMNQITVSDDVAKHNRLAQQYNTKEDFVRSAPAAIRTAVDSNSVKYTAMSTAEAANLAQQRIVSAQDDASKIREEAAKAGIQTTKDIRAEDRQATGDLLTAETRKLQEKDRVQAGEDRARNMIRLEEESKDRSFMRDEQLKLRQDAADQRRIRDEQKQDDIETQRKRDSYVAAALPGYNITTEKQLKALPPKERARLTAIVDSYDEDVGYAKLGPTPVDVLSNAQGMRKSFVGNSYQQQMVEVMGGIVSNPEKLGIIPGMKPEEVAQKKNAAILDTVKKWQDNPTVAGPVMRDGEQWKAFNILPIGDIATRPTFAANKFAIETTILKSTLPQGTEVTPSMVIASLAQKTKDEGNISAVAKDISDFYQQAIAYNNAALTPERYALPRQQTFNVPLNTGFFGGDNKYDLASVKGAHEALIRMQMAQIVRDSGGSVIIPTGGI